MDDAGLLWKSCEEDLQSQLTEVAWHTCFHSAVPVGIEGDHFVLSVPSPVFKERIESRYEGLVNGCLADAGAPHLTLRVEVREPDHDDLRDEAVPVGGFVEDLPPVDVVRAETQAAPRRQSPEDRVLINSRYTFDAYVIGTSNRFSHAAALAVAETPARNYNPLFIYGTAGLGKTHLLQAIGNYVLENYTSHTVRYVPTETLLNEFIEAIRRNERTVFKRRYREVDLLLIDDIQFLENQESLQEELFHMFNHLHQNNCQIVLSSDRPPNEIRTLEERLRSRFKMGLVTEVVPPDIETRLAILRKKAENEHPTPPAEVLDFIATHITSNIRELEGALTRVCAYSALTQVPLSLELAERVLADVISDHRPRAITPEAILDATCTMFGFPIDEIRGKSRRRPLVAARQISMYVFRELTDLSYPAIAREYDRDHTTVIHAVEKVTNQMKERRQVYDQVTELIQTIKNGN